MNLEPESGSTQVSVRRISDGKVLDALDQVLLETPVAFEFNGITHAVMLATPMHLADLALGFCLTEGIIDHAGQLHELEQERLASGITLHMRIASSAFLRLKERRRSLLGRTGCGLCGVEKLSEVLRPLPILQSSAQFDTNALVRAISGLSAQQSLQQATGAAHAAAWCDASGSVLELREDAGRHNALDKLAGALARKRIATGQGFVAVTSRASFEMVQKTVSLGAPLLAAISAPTSMAIDASKAAQLTLVGFARGTNLSVYADPARRLML